MTMLFYADKNGNLIGATLVNVSGDPVDGFTGKTALEGLKYVIASLQGGPMVESIEVDETAA